MNSHYILVIGGGNDTLFLLQQINLLGFKSIVVDRDPLVKSADIADEYLCLSTHDSAPILNAIRSKKIIACLTRSSGIATLCWSEVSQALGHKTPDPKTIEYLSSKLLLHKLCMTMNIATPVTKIFEKWEDLSDIQWPLVVKPEWEKVGKVGVTLVNYPENINCAAEHAKKYLAKGSVIVQEYLNGHDITILGVCLNNNYFPYAIFKEKNSFNDCKYISHLGFSKIDNHSAAPDMIKVAELICKEQQLGFSPLNLSFRIVGNTPYLMECNLDFGGEGILEFLLQGDESCNIIADYIQSFLSYTSSENSKKYMHIWQDRFYKNFN